MTNCPYCGVKIAKPDYQMSGEHYLIKDLEWAVEPSGDDPGVLRYKSGCDAHYNDDTGESDCRIS